VRSCQGAGCDKNLPRRDEQRRPGKGGCARHGGNRTVRRPVQLRHETELTSEAYLAERAWEKPKSAEVSPSSGRRVRLRAARHVPAQDALGDARGAVLLPESA
jgi:hypothetical protein